MGWVKIDDRYRTNPKIVQLGAEGLALDVAGLCFCAENETDGEIPYGVVPSLYPVRRPYRVADRLVEVGRWDRTESGYRIHDYLLYNPSKEELDKRRADTQQRVYDWRNRRRNGVTPPVANASSPSPSRSPKDITSPSDLSMGEPDGSQETASHSGDRLLPRLIGAVQQHGESVEQEAREVLSVARQHLADQFIDEGIGQMVSLEQPAKRPVYLLTLLNDWSAKRGLQIPELRLHQRAAS